MAGVISMTTNGYGSACDRFEPFSVGTLALVRAALLDVRAVKANAAYIGILAHTERALAEIERRAAKLNDEARGAVP